MYVFKQVSLDLNVAYIINLKSGMFLLEIYQASRTNSIEESYNYL